MLTQEVCGLTYILTVQLTLPDTLLETSIGAARILHSGTLLLPRDCLLGINVGRASHSEGGAPLGAHHPVVHLVSTIQIDGPRSRDFTFFLLYGSRVWQATTVGILKH